MTIVEYTPDQWADLQVAVAQMKGKINLSHRPFVDYYYATRSFAKLYLYRDDDGRVLGTIGRELLPFVYKDRAFTLRLGSNWYSLRPGIGRELLRFTWQMNPDSIGASFGGSDDTVSIAHHYDWIFIAGIKAYAKNLHTLTHPGEPGWRSKLRKTRGMIRERFSSVVAGREAASHGEVAIQEEREFSPGLLPRSSPFTFRFAPSLEHLAWRYNTSLSFVRYRLFRITARGTSVGYVILNVSPERILVAQCDGEDPEALAHGILLAVNELEREKAGRAVYLTSCVPRMHPIFESGRLKVQSNAALPLIIRREQWPYEESPDCSAWLVNYDWGDKGLRSPFLDERR
jgi:hypothetical protein